MTKFKKSENNKNTLVISLGDPAGIGTEITLKALGSKRLNKEIKPLLVGCKNNILKTYLKLIDHGINNIPNPKDLDIFDIPLEQEITPGVVDQNTGSASFKWLFNGINLVLDGKATALVTAPISKVAWYKAGHKFAGQTELLGHLTNKKPSMLFTAISPNNGWRFNTLLATTHIPLDQINNNLTKELIRYKLDALVSFCRKFKEKPHLFLSDQTL